MYTFIISKHNSLITLVAADKERKLEFKIKLNQYLSLPILHVNTFSSYSSMKFPKTNTGYNKSFFKKQITNEMKFKAIKDEIYSILS